MSTLPAPALSSLSPPCLALASSLLSFQQWPDPWDADPAQYRAAVLLPLMQSKDGQDLELVLSVRQTRMRRNAGEVAAPGGRFDPAHDTSLVSTALRETYEEIGIPPTSVTVLTTLPTFISRGMSKGGPVNLIMTPVVGLVDRRWWDERLMRLNDAEVAAVFIMRLGDFLKSANHSSLIYLWPENPRIVAVTHTFTTRHLQGPSPDGTPKVLYSAGEGAPAGTGLEPKVEGYKLSPVVGVTTNICVFLSELAHSTTASYRSQWNLTVSSPSRAPGGPPPPLTADQIRANGTGEVGEYPFRTAEELEGMRELLAVGPYSGGMCEERKIDLMGALTGRWKRKEGAWLGEERTSGRIVRVEMGGGGFGGGARAKV